MAPPAFIIVIVRPVFSFSAIKVKVISIWAFGRNIRTRLITFYVMINIFPIHPFVKRATVIKDSIQNYFHSSFVDFLNQFCKVFVTGFQILPICCSYTIFFSRSVISFPPLQQIPTIIFNDGNMRIYIVIILCIIFVIRR